MAEQDNADTIEALEAALRLAKAGQIRGGVMFFAYHDDRYAFRLCDVLNEDVASFSLMMGSITASFADQWMERNIDEAPELPASLALPDDDDSED